MTETQNKIVELTPEDVEIITASKLADIRPVYSGGELIGKKVVAMFWNGGMDIYSFEVEKLDDNKFGAVDDNWCYDLENAYMVVLKRDFIELKYKGLIGYEEKLKNFNKAFQELNGAFDDLEGYEKDLINENSEKYPFSVSLEDLRINDWVNSLITLDRKVEK